MGSNSLQKIEDIVLDHSLVPCEICGRTFLPDPLKKHQKVCERNATRKRKVFDSLKQRVLGTDLEPFHQRTYLRKPPESVAPVPTHTIPYTQPIVCSAPKATRHSKWKEKHLELMKAIRIAKGASPNEMSSKRSTAALRGPSTERCPSCDRQFGPKAFDRHVQWCKERQTRIQRSPASVLIAKERLEARTKYRVPPLGKSRRTTNREKYSPHVNRAESVSSVRTESSSNFERSPSTRKPKSVTNVMRIDTRKSEEQNSRTSVNETPKKSSGDTAKIFLTKRHPNPTATKINTPQINDDVFEMTVSPLHIHRFSEMEPERKLMTWKDTIKSTKSEVILKPVLNRMTKFASTSESTLKTSKTLQKVDVVLRKQGSEEVADAQMDPCCSYKKKTFEEHLKSLESGDRKPTVKANRSRVTFFDELATRKRVQCEESVPIECENPEDEKKWLKSVKKYLKTREVSKDLLADTVSDTESVLETRRRKVVKRKVMEKYKSVEEKPKNESEALVEIKPTTVQPLKQLEETQTARVEELFSDDQDLEELKTKAKLEESMDLDTFSDTEDFLKNIGTKGCGYRKRYGNFMAGAEECDEDLPSEDEPHERKNSANRSTSTDKFLDTKYPLGYMKSCGTLTNMKECETSDKEIEGDGVCDGGVDSELDQNDGESNETRAAVSVDEEVARNAVITDILGSDNFGRSEARNVDESGEDSETCTKEVVDTMSICKKTSRNNKEQESEITFKMETSTRNVDKRMLGHVKSHGSLRTKEEEAGCVTASSRSESSIARESISLKKSCTTLRRTEDESVQKTFDERGKELDESTCNFEDDDDLCEDLDSIGIRTDEFLKNIQRKVCQRKRIHEYVTQDEEQPHDFPPTNSDAIRNEDEFEDFTVTRTATDTFIKINKKREEEGASTSSATSGIRMPVKTPEKLPSTTNSTKVKAKSYTNLGTKKNSSDNLASTTSESGIKGKRACEYKKSYPNLRQNFENNSPKKTNYSLDLADTCDSYELPVREQNELSVMVEDVTVDSEARSSRVSSRQLDRLSCNSYQSLVEVRTIVEVPNRDATSLTDVNKQEKTFRSRIPQRTSFSDLQKKGSDDKDLENCTLKFNPDVRKMPSDFKFQKTKAAKCGISASSGDVPKGGVLNFGPVEASGGAGESKYHQGDADDVKETTKQDLTDLNSKFAEMFERQQKAAQHSGGTLPQTCNIEALRASLSCTGPENRAFGEKVHLDVRSLSDGALKRETASNLDSECRAFGEKVGLGPPLKPEVDASTIVDCDGVGLKYNYREELAYKKASNSSVTSQTEETRKREFKSKEALHYLKDTDTPPLEVSYGDIEFFDTTNRDASTQFEETSQRSSFEKFGGEAQQVNPEGSRPMDVFCTKASDVYVYEPVKRDDFGHSPRVQTPHEQVSAGVQVDIEEIPRSDSAADLIDEGELERFCVTFRSEIFRYFQSRNMSFGGRNEEFFLNDRTFSEQLRMLFQLYEEQNSSASREFTESGMDRREKYSGSSFSEDTSDDYKNHSYGGRSVISLLAARTSESTEMDSIQGDTVNIWTDALSSARLGDPLRKCHSEICFIQSPLSNVKLSTTTSLDLTTFLEPTTSSSKDDGEPLSDDRILEIAGQELVCDLTGNDSEVVPPKRRKLSPAVTDDLCLCQNNLKENINKIKQKIFDGSGSERNTKDELEKLEETSKEDLAEEEDDCETVIKDETPEEIIETLADASPRLRKILDEIANDRDEKEDHKKDVVEFATEPQHKIVLTKQSCKRLMNLDVERLPQLIGRSETARTPRTEAVKLPAIRRSSQVQMGKRGGSERKEREAVFLPPIEGGEVNQDRTRRSRSKSPEPTYNPFITAERQLMELLECDDFKPYASKTPHIDRPHTTNVHNHNKTTEKTQPKAIKSADKATKTKPSEVLTNGNRANTRSSIIDPPTGFDDTMLHDEFEFIENFINDNFSDVKTAVNNQTNKLDGGGFFLHQKQNDALNLKTILNERKYSDDLSSIDPNLINENDNLSIPDHLKSEEYSPTSSLGNYSSDATIRNVNEPDVYSVQYDNKIASLEPQIPKRPLDLVDELDQFLETLDSGAKPSPLVKTKSLRGNAKTKEAKKSTVSLVSSGGASAAKGGSKKNLSSLKRSISLMDPVPKPKPMKSKEDVRHYFQEQEMKSPTKNGRVSPEKGDGGVADASLKPEELFSVDDELYEEYKKYEEMYLKEKEEKLRNERKMAEMTTGVCTASEDDDCSGQTGNKISADSAYGSLNRKAPKVRARSTKLTPLEHQRPADAAGSLSSSSSETSPTPKNAAQRVPKFCHECGNKYPLTSAKFCVECGVKRLVL